ncbi:glycogen debranching N-terminal domain-containing protein [Salinispora arenicola]|uniref:glycogen debranching N-terminal domain-containing protein n=1 Tax=Salinispora arenicola TaxID=168697 RepID=UPI0016AA8C16|nr:glycogen debranching N-terminal domain-containing protein [Salinispora arenicola]NIL55630.1 hypothetical protein [Salinispora arenicola]NIL64380.1 hypothetical protein [Salinispora arenicola]
MADVRPTPDNPLPGVTDTNRQVAQARDMPPEFGPETMALVNGSTFMYCDQSGDVPAGTIGGLVHEDTRLLNRWELRLDGARLLTLRSVVLEYYKMINQGPRAPSHQGPPRTH